MLACRKCHRDLTEGFSQQSFCELETTLLVRWPPIQAHRLAMKNGPLCDTCLASWQADYKADTVSSTAHDARSAAIKRLDSACSALGHSLESSP